MFRDSRDRSPSYSPPRARRFSPPARRRRRSSSRDDGGVSPPRGQQQVSICKRDRSPEDVKSSVSSSYPWEDEEILQTLNCKACSVTLHDRDSMMSHLKGRPHLSQQQRLRDKEVRIKTGGRGLNDVLKPDKQRLQYEDNFWDKSKAPRTLLPEQERFLDETRLDRVKANFDRDKYDHGQFKYKEEELHCEICDVYTRSRDQMQAHKEGQNHKKRSAKVQRYNCEICLIEVPCQETLDNHMRGKDHIKREKQLQEKRRERGETVPGDSGMGFRTGPIEMAKLSNNEREELEALRKSVKYLQGKVKELTVLRSVCKKEHGTEEVTELRKYKQWCEKTHIRPKEFQRPGIFCKKEEPADDNEPSTSWVKNESKYSGKSEPYINSESREYVEKGYKTDM